MWSQFLSNGGFGGIYEKLPAKLKSHPRGHDHRVSRPHFIVSPAVMSLLCILFLLATLLPGGDAGHLRVAGERPTGAADGVLRLARRSCRASGAREHSPAAGNGIRTLDMPVWNALYQVRNFAANIENVRAQDASGAAVDADNTKPSEWQVTAPAGLRRGQLRHPSRQSRALSAAA